MPCPTPCAACKPGDLPILFTRYGVGFSAHDSHRQALGKLTPKGQFRPPETKLGTAAGYNVRMLRRGVLYVLIERAGAKRWTGYQVHPHGYLSAFDPETTPVPEVEAQPACEMVIRGANRSLVWVPDPLNVPNLWYFFNPDPVLPDILAKLKDDPSKLHHIPVSTWVNACPDTAHTCAAGEAQTAVAELAALDDITLLDALNEQIYGVMGTTIAERGYERGQPNALVPVYVNKHKGITTIAPPADDIFSADNPQGAWRRTETLRENAKPSYAQIHRKRLAQLATTLEGAPGTGKLPGLVAACDDAIGITQELNHWRNKAYRDLILWGDAVDASPKGNRQSRRTRFQVAHHWPRLGELYVRAHQDKLIRGHAHNFGVQLQGSLILDEMNEDQRKNPQAYGTVFNTREERDEFMARVREDIHPDLLARPSKQWAAYSAGLDTSAMAAYEKHYAEEAAKFEEKAQARAGDHLAWIRSPGLLAALSVYDGEGRQTLSQGIKLSAQLNGMLEGLNGGGAAAEAQLMAWAGDFKDNPANLLWRAYLLNQASALSSLASELESAVAPGTNPAQAAALLKNLVDGFAKLNDMLDPGSAQALAASGAGAAAHLAYQRSLRVAAALPLFGIDQVASLLQHALFRLGAGKSALENKLIHKLMLLCASRAGRADGVAVVVTVALEHQASINEHRTRRSAALLKGPGAASRPAAAPSVPRVLRGLPGVRLPGATGNGVLLGGKRPQPAPETRVAAVFKPLPWEPAPLKATTETRYIDLKRENRRVLDAIVNDGKSGEFFKMRLTGALAVLEGFLLLAKARELSDNQDSAATLRLAAEFGAAGLMVSAAALETGAVTQAWLVSKSPAPEIQAMASIRMGGFKLAGGALASVAGVVGAVLDGSAAVENFKENKSGLMLAYGGRAASSAVSIISATGLSIAAAQPLLESIAENNSSKFYGFAANTSKFLAQRRALLFATSWGALVITVAISFVIAVLSDDELEKWIKRSAFRLADPKEKTKTDPYFQNPDEEFSTLLSAFAGIA